MILKHCRMAFITANIHLFEQEQTHVAKSHLR